jgi:hypothetical protein
MEINTEPDPATSGHPSPYKGYGVHTSGSYFEIRVLPPLIPPYKGGKLENLVPSPL